MMTTTTTKSTGARFSHQSFTCNYCPRYLQFVEGPTTRSIQPNRDFVGAKHKVDQAVITCTDYYRLAMYHSRRPSLYIQTTAYILQGHNKNSNYYTNMPPTFDELTCWLNATKSPCEIPYVMHGPCEQLAYFHVTKSAVNCPERCLPFNSFMYGVFRCFHYFQCNSRTFVINNYIYHSIYELPTYEFPLQRTM
jgi:hypothetical protein